MEEQGELKKWLRSTAPSDDYEMTFLKIITVDKSQVVVGRDGREDFGTVDGDPCVLVNGAWYTVVVEKDKGEKS